MKHLGPIRQRYRVLVDALLGSAIRPPYDASADGVPPVSARFVLVRVPAQQFGDVEVGHLDLIVVRHEHVVVSKIVVEQRGRGGRHGADGFSVGVIDVDFVNVGQPYGDVARVHEQVVGRDALGPSVVRIFHDVLVQIAVPREFVDGGHAAESVDIHNVRRILQTLEGQGIDALIVEEFLAVGFVPPQCFDDGTFVGHGQVESPRVASAALR
mmetsp:Transcript_14581/g.24934  ORF Transcript_14581/g.24934 Transcript_14581/m.24934 type:complete len:212 (+) Transcript_14581:430-1065(+)